MMVVIHSEQVIERVGESELQRTKSVLEMFEKDYLSTPSDLNPPPPPKKKCQSEARLLPPPNVHDN